MILQDISSPLGTASPDAKPPLVLALDVGSSSARALLYDAAGRQVEGCGSRIAYRMETTSDGGVEISADLLATYIARIIDGALDSINDQAPDLAPGIAAVAMCTFWHGLLGVDVSGRPATPLFSWNDTRAAAASRDLRARVNERETHARTGCPLHASYWPAKIAWLRSADPQTFRRVRRWMSVGEYFHLLLFGDTLTSISMASATGLFNQHACAWDSELLSLLDIHPESLLPLAPAGYVFTGLKADYARRWPALANAKWVPALGDGACSNIGAGGVTRDRAVLAVGTSSALRVLWRAAGVRIPEGLWCYRADGERYVMGGALSEGGNLYAWMRDTLKLGPEEQVENQIAAMEPDAHGLTVLPFLSGERSPGWAADARATVTGLSLNTTPPDILRAGLEAVAYRLAAVYEMMVVELGEFREVIASGGALLRSPAWTQIISDVLGKEVLISASQEASSRGAALMALAGLGVASIEEQEAFAIRRHSADPGRHARYAAARERQNRLYQLLIGHSRMT